MDMFFENRSDAGKKLVKYFIEYKKDKNVIVLGLPRGGVETAFEVAQALDVPLDIIVTRKIGAPMQPELAVGALTQDGQSIIDQGLMEQLGLTVDDLKPIIKQEKKELQRRLNLYRKNKKPLNIKNKIVILVDDGIATGATMRAAIQSVKKLKAEKIIVAIPVCPFDSLKKIKKMVDEVVCLHSPQQFSGVGAFYKNFVSVEDEVVIKLLQR